MPYVRDAPATAPGADEVGHVAQLEVPRTVARAVPALLGEAGVNARTRRDQDRVLAGTEESARRRDMAG